MAVARKRQEYRQRLSKALGAGAILKRMTGKGALIPNLITFTCMEESFFDNVFEVAKLIPKGRVTSYGAIANYLGLKRSARMVGYAMNAAHGDRSIPAHRVVNRNGMLTGKHHFGKPDEMQKRLEKEGIKVKNDKIVNFEKYFWDPAVELGL